ASKPAVTSPGTPAPRVAESAASVPVKQVKSATPPAPTESAASGPRCKECRSHTGSILYGKYGYYFQCAQCQTNTAIKFTCLAGHKPRLRKAGSQFYRDCA